MQDFQKGLASHIQPLTELETEENVLSSSMLKVPFIVFRNKYLIVR